MLVEYPLHEGDDDDPKHPTEGDHHHRHGGQQPGLAVTPVSGANKNLRVIFYIVFMAAKRSIAATPTSTHTFSTPSGSHVSPHRDAVFFHAKFWGRRILIGGG